MDFLIFLAALVVIVLLGYLIYTISNKETTAAEKLKIKDKQAYRISLEKEYAELRNKYNENYLKELALKEKAVNSLETTKASLIQQVIQQREKTYNELAAIKDNYLASYEEWEAEQKKKEDAILGRVNQLIEAERSVVRLKVEAEEIDIHSLLISSRAALELNELRRVITDVKLSNPMPFYKAIYDVYLRNPLSTLVEAVEVKKKSGIYKITNNTKGRSYIGQSTDIAERWKQHIKRGCGAEIGTIAGGGLYEAMMEDGVENFSFFLVEETTKDKLNERERYWINFYDTKTFGYNLK